MMRIQLILCVLVALLAISACEQKKDPFSKKTNSSEPISGEKIYKMYCVNCHGLDGKLEFNGAKDMNLSELSLEERVLLVRNGRKLMTPFKDILTDKEIKAVAEYSMKYKAQ